MSSDNHTPITTGAAAIASTFNNPMGELDAAIGDLSTLTTTEQGSAVGAINETFEGLDLFIKLKTNRHLDLDGTDEAVQTSDYYLQIDSCSAETDLNLPAISDFGIGKEINFRITAPVVASAYLINLVPDSGDGDSVIGGSTITPITVGDFIFRTVASYPGETGACWVLMVEGSAFV